MNQHKKYEFLEHTADIMFRAWGRTAEEMFENAALAMFNVMIDTATVRPDMTWRVELAAIDIEQLSYDWLSELLFLLDSEVAVFCSFDVSLSHEEEGGWTLSADVRGERIDRSRHLFETEVKAVTFHRFKVWRGGQKDADIKHDIESDIKSDIEHDIEPGQKDGENRDWMIQAILDV